MRHCKLAAIAGATLLLLSSAGALAQVDCPVIGGGGNSTGDGSILVVGQVIIGDAGPGNELAQGAVHCWFPYPFGDANCDGILSPLDLAAFADQMDGPDNPIVTFCEPGVDLDDDGDGDMLDMATFQTTYAP